MMTDEEIREAQTRISEYWVSPSDVMPPEMVALDTERYERTPDGKYITGFLIQELLIYLADEAFPLRRRRRKDVKPRGWYTPGLKRFVGPLEVVKRWKPLV